MITFRALLLALAAGGGAAVLSGATGPAVPGGLSITFLANEGVLLSARDEAGVRKVLIDALFEPYESYAVPAESTRTTLRSGRAPYDAVDLILITHRHGDHFHPVPVAQHLRANPRAVLVTSQQVVDSLRGRLTPELTRSQRIAARTLPAGAHRTLLVNGIQVRVLGLAHGGRRHRRVEHLAFVVDLGGRRVLHVGDAELSEAALAPLGLDTMRIDVALVPYWTVTDDASRRAIERWIHPKELVAFHLAAEDSGTEREIRSAVAEARVFLRPLERIER